MRIVTNRLFIIEICSIAIGAIASILIVLQCKEPGFEWLWLLPATFSVCSHVLVNVIIKNNYTLFFIFFDVVAFLRYVIGPILLVYTDEYYGRIVRAIPSDNTIKIAIMLMCFELLACSTFFWIYNKTIKNTKHIFLHDTIALPERMWVYILLFVITALLTIVNPVTLNYFSFATIGMTGLQLSNLTIIQQITIMFQLCSKYFVFIAVLTKIKKEYDKSAQALSFEILAVLFTFVWSMLYAGHNRADFLFSVICQFYVFSLLFPKHRKNYIILVVSIVLIILPFMTRSRNYTDYYSDVVGMKRFLYTLSGMIGSYFGGVTNVGVSVEMTDAFSAYKTVTQFIKDLVVPIVGINKIIPIGDGMISNTLFNYQFFATVREPSQILPSIGQGYFYFGFLLAPLLDIVQLLFILFIEKTKGKTNSFELIYLFNIVEMRFALMFGQNITQQINCLSMELMLPIVIYYLNHKIALYTKRG